MAGRVQWEAQVDSNVAKLLSETKELRDQLDGIKKGNYEIKLNIDDKKLEKVISNLDKMLESLGKGTGDFKEFENLSKQLNEIVLEVKELNKAFGGINDSGVSNLLSSIQSIDKSLSSLSEHITNVNKDFGSVGKNASDNVGQINEARKATEGLTEATRELANAQKNVGNKSNISSGNGIVESQNKIQEELKETREQAEKTLEAIEKVTVYRGTNGGNPLTANKNGATFWDSKKDIAKLYGTNSDDKTLWSSQISIKNPLTIDAQGSKYGDITYLGDGIEETSKKIIELTEREKELRTALQNSTDSGEEQVKMALELSNVCKEIKSISDDISNPYGTHATDWWVDYAKQNGYDGIHFKNVIDTPDSYAKENAELSDVYVTLQKEQIENATLLAKANHELAESERQVALAQLGVIENQNTPIKDTFQGDLKASESAASLGKEADEMKEIAEVTPKATKAKNEFADANERVDKGAKKSSESISEEASHLDKIGTKLDKYRKDFNNFSAVPDADHRFASFETQLSDLDIAITKLETHQNALKDKGFVDEADINETKRLSTEIDNLIEKIKKVPQSKRGYKDVAVSKMAEKIASILEQHPRLAKKAKAEIQGYYNELASGNPTRPLDEILDRVNKIIQGQREAGRTGKGFIDILSDKALYGQAAQLASYYLSLTDFIRYGQQGIQIIRELDTALTEMRKVSSESISTLKEFQGVSFDIADTIGTTAKQIQNSTADWMRLGYSISEASALAENSNIYKNVGDMEIDEATEHMVSSVQAWKSEFNDNVIETSEAVINRYNKIGNEFAISSADIGEAMETSAAALKAGGNSLNESLGLLTAGNIIQQDASTTSAALKILSLRIRGAKAELEEMGESTDGLADSSSKMREELKALTGVDIMLDEDTFKSTAQIIQEMGENWSKMTDVSQAAALEKIAGKNRASTVAGLIENYETIAEVIEAAENAEGSALAENEKYLDSIDGKMQQLENRAQEFWFKLIDSEAIKDGIDLLSSLVKGATDFVDTFGVLGTAGLGAGLFASFKGAGRVKIAYPHLYTYACRNKTLYA